ncbi:MAG: ABC transporter permease [Lewinellaceae bacterium]|nr:ABC transporter permease [Lewinellaceae bacterium]
MLKNTIFSFGLAIQNIRNNLFHTILSVLGIVIGVAALVAILSFIDGLERFAKNEITGTTSLNAILINPIRFKQMGDIKVPKDSFAVLDYPAYSALVSGLSGVAMSALYTSGGGEIWVDTASQSLGAHIQFSTRDPRADTMLLAGRAMSDADVEQRRPVALVNKFLAKKVLGHERYGELMGKKLHHKKRELEIIGVVKAGGDDPTEFQVRYPISLLEPDELKKNVPNCFVEASGVEQVAGLKKQITERLGKQFPGKADDFEVLTNDYRVEQAAVGFRIFRIIMGLIVGISIVVGGIGVMNVLLISVNDRVNEIGIRKAVGANRRDILRQFLAESITVSAFGSAIGLLFGILISVVAVAIIRAVTEVPFEAAYTWNTFITISIISVLVGVIFGTYPAVKASRLDPVEAIRRE